MYEYYYLSYITKYIVLAFPEQPKTKVIVEEMINKSLMPSY